jgi:hypothetical protein
MNHYTQNSLVRISAVITSAAGLPISPSGLVVRVMAPDYTVADITASVVIDSVGNIHADFVALQSGPYQYEVLAASPQIAAVGQFIVFQETF